MRRRSGTPDRNHLATYPMPGQLFDVGGHRLHISCMGSGTPTVVLEAGLGEPGVMMAGWIQPGVATSTSVCVYDRAGKGWSEPIRSPQDGFAVAADLHSLLREAHIAGPYVLAGHSSGGVYVQVFAERYEQAVDMCLTCGCMRPYDDLGNPDNLEKSAAASGVSVDKSVANLVKTWTSPKQRPSTSTGGAT